MTLTDGYRESGANYFGACDSNFSLRGSFSFWTQYPELVLRNTVMGVVFVCWSTVWDQRRESY